VNRHCEFWTVSALPARIIGRGAIAPGLGADFIRVREFSGVPVVVAGWREGRRVI